MSPNNSMEQASSSSAAQPHSGITRGSRACNECRRMKIRCMREGEEPCRRCDHLNISCTYTRKPRESKRHRSRASKSQSTKTADNPPLSDSDEDDGGMAERRETKRRMLGFERELEDLRAELRGPRTRIRQSSLESSSCTQRGSKSPQNVTDLVKETTSSALEDGFRGAAAFSALRSDDLLTSNHLVAPFRQLRTMADENRSRAASHDQVSDPTFQIQTIETLSVSPPEHASWRDKAPAVVNDTVGPLFQSNPASGFSNLGCIKEEEAKELFDYFFANCHDFTLVHDAEVDTWETMRSRKSIALASIIAVAAMVRDASCNTPTEAQRIAVQTTQSLVLGTLFDRTHHLEDVQAIITIGTYHHNSWLLLGHAVRLATDMGLDTAFPRLLANRVNEKSTPTDVEQDRDLVVRARLWFALYAHEHQMSFANGRAPLIREDGTTRQCRRFLDHPLSTPADVRLLALVELLSIRTPLHIHLTSSSDNWRTFSDLLKQLSRDLDDWYRYYDNLVRDGLNMDSTSYYRESLRTQREYASLYANSLHLRGISSVQDLQRLSDEDYMLALGALRSAHACLDIVTKGTSYPLKLRFATSHTHMSIAFAASFLLRTVHLFPGRIDNHEVIKSVEDLANMLNDCGARRLARTLRIILTGAGEGRSKAVNIGNGACVAANDQSILSEVQTSDLSMPNLDFLLPFDGSTVINGPAATNDFGFTFDDFWLAANNPEYQMDQIQPLQEPLIFANPSVSSDSIAYTDVSPHLAFGGM